MSDLNLLNPLQEKYYQTIFSLIFELIGLRADADVRTNRGRIDAVVELADSIFLFEFKLDGSEEEALEQIKTAKYYERYRSMGKALRLVGVNLDTPQHDVAGWQTETLAA